MRRRMREISLDNAKDIFIDILRDANDSKGTIDAYEKDLRKFVEYIKSKGIEALNEIDHTNIERFLEYLVSVKELKLITAYRYFSSLRRFFSEMYNQDYTTHIPTDRIDFDRPKSKESNFYLTTREINRIIDEARKEEGLRKYRDVAALTLLAETGVRRSDMLDLNWNDIDFYERKINLHIQKVRSSSLFQ